MHDSKLASRLGTVIDSWLKMEQPEVSCGLESWLTAGDWLRTLENLLLDFPLDFSSNLAKEDSIIREFSVCWRDTVATHNFDVSCRLRIEPQVFEALLAESANKTVAYFETVKSQFELEIDEELMPVAVQPGTGPVKLRSPSPLITIPEVA